MNDVRDSKVASGMALRCVPLLLRKELVEITTTLSRKPVDDAVQILSQLLCRFCAVLSVDSLPLDSSFDYVLRRSLFIDTSGVAAAFVALPLPSGCRIVTPRAGDSVLLFA